MTPAFVMAGSILADTAAHRLERIETALAITADGDVGEIAAAVDQAERMCFVLDALQRAHPVTRSTSVNGAALDGSST